MLHGHQSFRLRGDSVCYADKRCGEGGWSREGGLHVLVLHGDVHGDVQVLRHVSVACQE